MFRPITKKEPVIFRKLFDLLKEKREFLRNDVSILFSKQHVYLINLLGTSSFSNSNPFEFETTRHICTSIWF
jgi:hypothetical protein